VFEWSELTRRRAAVSTLGQDIFKYSPRNIMLQLTLSNSEKAQLRAAVKDMKGTIAAKGNAPLSAGTMAYNSRLCSEHFATLCRLKALLPQSRIEGEQGHDARVEFLKTVWLAGITSDLTGYAFYDVFDVGDREYGSCFEWGPDVMNELVRKASRSKTLRTAALELYSESEWRAFETRVAAGASA
jgi:hypothetical protein